MSDIHTQAYEAKDFESKAEHLLHEVRDTGGLIEITEEGQDSVFMIKANRTQLLSLMEDLAILSGIQEGLNDAKAGNLHSLDDVFSDLGHL